MNQTEDNGSAVATEATKWRRQSLFQGWSSVAGWMTFGLLLEGLLGFKTPAYLFDSDRRELFRLAHAHGTLLGLILLAAALCSQVFQITPPRAGRLALRLGAFVMPFGFLLAGIWHYESDPGLGIWLVPPSAALLVFGTVTFALAARGRKREGG